MCDVVVLYSEVVLYTAVMYFSTFSPYDYRGQGFPVLGSCQRWALREDEGWSSI